MIPAAPSRGRARTRPWRTGSRPSIARAGTSIRASPACIVATATSSPSAACGPRTSTHTPFRRCARASPAATGTAPWSTSDRTRDRPGVTHTNKLGFECCRSRADQGRETPYAQALGA